MLCRGDLKYLICASRLYQLRQLKRANAVPDQLMCFYKTCIRPVTEYAFQTFHDGLPRYLSEELETIQRRALKIISPALNYEQALNEHSMTTLHQRRKDLTEQLFKEINDDSNHKLYSLLPPRKSTNIALRRRRTFNTPIFSKQRLAFLNKEGFDRFGRNKYLAPLLTWETFKEQLEGIKSYAMDYENAYNQLQEAINNEDNTDAISKKLPESVLTQVKEQKSRLMEDKRIALTEKGLYVPAIKELEVIMSNALVRIKDISAQLSTDAEFTIEDMFAIMQGITGFLGDVLGGDPWAALGTFLGTYAHFAVKCTLSSLGEIKGKLNKWLTFGKEYKALQDSSELDFDRLDPGAVPEVMQANLDMNKEGLTADLVCLLTGRLPEHHSGLAEFNEQIERFFIAGSARIDLIAKVIDLDNDIGGHNFNIPNLEETASKIENLRNSEGSPIAENIQQTFLDDLLTSYQNMENTFLQKLWLLYKSFEFRTLWPVSDSLIGFQRTTSEAAPTTGQLQGIVQLNKVFQEIDQIENKGQNCFTKFGYVTDTHKWSFDQEQHIALFNSLHQGKASFHLHIKDSCPTCFNVRVLKLVFYVIKPVLSYPSSSKVLFVWV
ncbi:hypothetical protein AC249_AIPGENE11276 [Exaiptasia diaphana]|nr:hypothetical protein AC249_AIPGENE11276 [Exaiptasia diaphana]